MWSFCRRASSAARIAPDARFQKKSHVKWKLDHYVETGQLKRRSDEQHAVKNTRSTQKSIGRLRTGPVVSPQKTLLLFRALYDNIGLVGPNGEKLDATRLKPLDFTMKGDRLRSIFAALAEARRVLRRKIDPRLLMPLLGVTKASLEDSYFVAHDVLLLLQLDDDPARALELCRLAHKNASVGMNAVLEWYLQRGKVEEAKRLLITGKKWGVPITDATYVTYFSGLANHYAAGAVPEKLALEVSELVAAKNVPQTIETFNAALKLLVKDHAYDQARAWAVFDSLEQLKVAPDSQTFTIFLQGVKTFYTQKAGTLRADPALASGVRTSALFANQAKLVLVANLVFERAMQLATPPEPPTKEQVAQNELLLAAYKSATRQPLLDIDRHLVLVFLLCYTDANAGTAASAKLGSHYLYLERALVFLQAWVPEIKELADACYNGSLTADPEVKRKTDIRVERAQIPSESLPQAAIATYEAAELNPLVKFPPSPFSRRKSAAIYSGVERPVVDLARVRFADLHKEFLRLEEEKKRGSRSRKALRLSRDEHSVNKFLFRIFFECLARLGRAREFHSAMWHVLHTFGGLNVDVSKLAAESKLSEGVLAKRQHPEVPWAHLEERKAADLPNAILDIGLVEDFIFKIEEHFAHADRPVQHATELVAALSNRQITRDPALWPRPATFNALFAMLNRDIYYLNEKNRGDGRRANEKRRLADNTAKVPLTTSQLTHTLDALLLLVKSIFARFGGRHMDDFFVTSYNTLIDRLYAATWTDAPDNHVNCLLVHRKIVHLGILMWQPEHLRTAGKRRESSQTITKSMEFIYRALKDRKDLGKLEVYEMLRLRGLLRLDTRADDAEARLEALKWRLFQILEGKDPKVLSDDLENPV